jgi:hypothetical protein
MNTNGLEEKLELDDQILFDLLDVVNKYKDKIPEYELSQEMIKFATGLALWHAPDELDGIENVLTCVQLGISEYRESKI